MSLLASSLVVAQQSAQKSVNYTPNTTIWDMPGNVLQGRPPLNLRTIDRGSGLPNDNVNYLFQDRLGLVWICTDRGLVHILPWSEFSVYGPKQGLLHSTVLRMDQTSDGRIFVGTHQGGIYTLGKDRLSPFQEDIFGGHTIYQMVADKHNQLFLDLGSSYGYLDANRKWHLLGKDNNHQQRKFLLLPDSSVMLAAGQQYQVYDFANYALATKPVLSLGGDMQAAVPISICFDKVIYSVQDKLVIMQWDKGQLIPYVSYPDLGRHLETATMMPDGRLWLGYRDLGMVLLDRGKAYRYTSSNYLLSNYIKHIKLDREGSLWIGTYGNGLQHLSEPHLWFYQKTSGFTENSIVTVAGDAASQTMAAATSSGFYIWQNQTIRSLPDPALTNIRCIAFDGPDRIVAASENMVYDIKLKPNGRHQSSSIAQLQGARYICALPKRKAQPNRYLITTASSVYQLTGDKLSLFVNLPLGADIGHLQVDSEVVWALGQNGRAYQISFEGQIMRALTKAQGLPQTSITSVAHDKTGVTWVGTDSGLYKMPAQAKILTPYVALASGIVGIFKYQNQFWALTEKHLYQQLDTGWRKCQSYKTISNEKGSINMVSFLPESNQLLMATSRGLVISNLDRWQPYQGRFNMVALSAFANWQKFDFQKPTNCRFYEGIESVRFKYQITDYNCNGDVRFYIRQVHDEDTTYFWLASKEYSLVKPEAGQYQLSICGVGQEGVVTDNTLEFGFTIIPLWYKQGWFIYLMGVMLIGLFWVSAQGYSTYLYHIKLRELRTVQRIQAERERISRDLHDSVGSQLVYIVNALEQVKRMELPSITNTAQQAIDAKLDKEDLVSGPITSKAEGLLPELNKPPTDVKLPNQPQDKYNQKLNELTTLARTTIQNLRESIWVLHQGGEIDLLNFVERIRRYLDQVKALSHIRVHEYIDVADGGNLTPTQALNLFRIMQEAVTNVVRHSQAAEFDLGASWDGKGLLLLEVNDKGSGFDLSRHDPATKLSPDSYGITNMHYRAAEIGATLSVLTSAGNGTRIRIELAINEVTD